MKIENPLIAILLVLALHIAAAHAVVFTSNTSIGTGDTTHEGDGIVVSNCTLTVDGAHAFASLLLIDGAVLTHSPAPSGQVNNRLDLAITGEMTIDATSRLDVNAKGYGSGAGPGAATNDMSGGGHGGLGGANSYGQAGGVSYGDLLAPTVWGSGGGGGGAGGGWVRLGVRGVLTVAGQLTANGESAWRSGGAGGSIHVIAGTLAGAGTISAKGGDCGYTLSGGGGGGRIAMYYGSSSFSGAISAAGGLNPANKFGNNGCCGAAGTLYTKASSQSVGDLLLDNSRRTNAMETLITAPVAYRLTLTNVTAYATNPLTLSGLRVSTNSLLTHPFQGPRLQVLVQGNAVVEGGGAIGADTRGYPGQTGPGKGIWYGGSEGVGAGAGHGGQGGACWSGPGGVAYDSETEPVDFGSGGAGSGVNRGGGAIQLTVAGTLTIDGRLSVNADAVSTYYHGGGAGGSIHVIAGTLAGAGTISAKGGACGYTGAGGGGGGRIAMYYGSSSFSGAISAAGGLNPANRSGSCGAAGTLYTKASSQSVGDMLLDNSGRTNAMETLITAPVAYRLTLTNVTAYATNPITLSGLRVCTNSLLTHPFQGPRLQVLVQGNAVVEGGGAIGADTRGYPGQTGPGKGLWYGGAEGVGSGAGHGGQGSACWSGPGGATYDSVTEPVDFGSGGGASGANRGGGAIQLTVAGTLTIDGRLSVNADAVTTGYIGGGAGGSIWLTASRLNGSGTITANGEIARYSGAGSGGGGRIAIYTGVNQLAGAVTASGGLSANRPGANGTVYYSTNVSPPLAGTTRIFSTQFEAAEGFSTTTNLVGQNGWLGAGSGGNGMVSNYFVGQGQQAFIGYYPSSSPRATTNIFSTQFEAAEGYSTTTDLVGQNGWLGAGSGGNGVMSNYFAGQGQQAYIGFFPPDPGADLLTVWRPINFSPIPTNMPVVQFSVLMNIVDSSNTNYDDFYWSVCNTQGDRLFTLDFCNYDRCIYYKLDGTNNWVWTGQTFANDDIHTLAITMDFAQNSWSAKFGGVLLVGNKPITTTGAPLNLGDVDAGWWMRDPANPGDNYMVFDNYRITAEILPPDPGDGRLTIWRPINFSPIPTNMPVVQFSVLMSIVDSSNAKYDDFFWSVYNTQGDRLFTLDFCNHDRCIYYKLDGTNNWVWTGQTFANYDTNTLVITMNFIENYWSATFGGVPLGKNKRITTTVAPLNLGQVNAGWTMRDPAHPGDNYMVFDNYQITAEVLPPVPPPTTTNTFFTQFETTEGYSTDADLTGQNGWLDAGSGGNGVVTNYFAGQGQQAFIGFFPPDPDTDWLTVWRPINFSPIAANMPVVRFSVLMSIVDSYNNNYDDFYWSVYNAQGDRLFTLDFCNYDRCIYYKLDGTNNWVWTGQTFANYDTNTLVITMNFIQNSWSATFGGVPLGENKPITTTGVPLNLGDVDARWWIRDRANPGDNYMLFDNYRITAEVLPPVPPPATTNTFFTQFEATEGYSTAADLAGQNGWIGTGSGGNGVVTNYFAGQGQQAFIGFFPPDPGADRLTVWRPINFSPIATNRPVVRFSVLMSIVDSYNNNYDDFYWSVYNTQGDRLFTLDFNNYDHGIYYQLDGTNNWVWTGQTFANNDTNTLVITMNFIENSWSATFGGVLLGKNKRITTTDAPLNLGDVDAVWAVFDPAHPGDNYMLFDNYQITAEVLPPVPPPATTNTFFTQFETTEGYSTAADLAGQNGWLGAGSGGNGVVTNYFAGQGQQAFIGFFPPDPGTDRLTVWHPINFSPIPTNMPVVRFSVLMSIVDSSNNNYDDFYWSVYNTQGDRLFTLDFDNYDRCIYYKLDGTNNWVWTGQTFTNDDTNMLVITMNFIENSWSATFGGVPLGENKRITTTDAPLNLGDVDAVWAVFDPANPGDNYMVFDNYQITAEVLPPVPPPATTNTFFTQFETTEGYSTAADLAGQNGWLGAGSGGNGVVTNYFAGQGQQAFIGFFPPDPGTDRLTVWRPINFSPTAANMPVVRFSVLMSIVDSSNTNYDDFQWCVYNAQGDRLFTLDFDNYTRRIYYQLDGTNNWVWTGQTFTNDDTNTLVISMNLIQNSWSATFGGGLLATNQPITTTGAPLNLGDVDAVWLIYDPAHPGDNYMVFDNYQITAEVLPPPTVIAQYPSGSVSRFVSHVDVTFNQPVDPATFTTNDLVLTAPSGPIPASQITLSSGDGVTWRIGFPTQTANGACSLTVGPHIANLSGREMTAIYSGGFTVNFTTPTAIASQTGGNPSLIWLSAAGLSYQLQSATNLPATDWINEGAPLDGTGGWLTNTPPMGVQTSKFFRLLLLEN